MATDVWLVWLVGLVLGSNSSFGDTVSSLYLSVERNSTHTGQWTQRLSVKSVGAVVSDGDLGQSSILSGTGTDGAKHERYFGETGGGHAPIEL